MAVCMPEHVSADCAVIGGGISACMAAREIRRAGRSVAVLRDGFGASPFIHGIELPVGKGDSPACLLQDTLAGGYSQSDPALTRALAEHALAVREEIEGLGLSFNRTEAGEFELLQPLGASVPRVASVGNALGALALKKLCEELEGSFLNVRALKIFGDGGFSVLAYAGEKPVVVTARAVLFAAGGFGNLYSFSTTPPDIGGDGIAMADSLSVPLTDLEFVQFEPSVAVSPARLRGKSVITTMFHEGAVLLNTRGERFMFSYSEEGECAQKDVLARAIRTEIREGRGTENGGVYYDCTALGREKLLRSYSAYFDRYKACGIDISKQPMEIAAGAHTTLGGIEIDSECRTAREGVFACGEVAGGVHGANRLGGNAGLETFVFGKIAGRSVAAYLEGGGKLPSGREAAEFSKKSVPHGSLKEERKWLGEILTEHLGVLRSEESCERAEELLSGISVPESADREALRLANDRAAALLLAKCCKERKGSVGCHYRTDGVPEEKYTLRVVNGAVGRISHEEDNR